MRSGYSGVVEWAIKNQCPAGKWTCAEVAVGEHLGITVAEIVRHISGICTLAPTLHVEGIWRSFNGLCRMDALCQRLWAWPLHGEVTWNFSNGLCKTDAHTVSGHVLLQQGRTFRHTQVVEDSKLPVGCSLPFFILLLLELDCTLCDASTHSAISCSTVKVREGCSRSSCWLQTLCHR